MPTITKGDLVLVTGASGFIAAHTVREFLKNGYRVRGTVRSEDKGEYLKNLFKGEGEFDYVLVDDITKEGIFDEAVKGVDAVAHTASPFYIEGVTDPKELIDPAVKGTTGVLKSIQKSNPGLKRVVITSSVASVMATTTYPTPHRYTEEIWNVDSPKLVEEKGADAPNPEKYRASKTLAERALWDFVEKEKPSWEASAINPPLVLGEVIHQVNKPESLNTSVAGFYAYAVGKKGGDDVSPVAGNWVNVKDVAKAHVRALEVKEAAGERFITSQGPFSEQDYLDILRKRYPDLKNVAEGKLGAGKKARDEANVFIGDKAAKVLGIQYESFEDTLVEMADSLRKRFDF